MPTRGERNPSAAAGGLVVRLGGGRDGEGPREASARGGTGGKEREASAWA